MELSDSAGDTASAEEGAWAGEATSVGESAAAGEGTSRGAGSCSCSGSGSGAASWGEPEIGEIGVIGLSSVVSSLGSAGTIPLGSGAMDRRSERRSAAAREGAASWGEGSLRAAGAAGPTVGR